MKSSFKLFTIRGIDVRIHFTLLIFLLLPLAQLGAYDSFEQGIISSIYLFLFFIVLFASVLVHELAHSFVAIRKGSKVGEITLWPLGGIANIGSFDEPKKEFQISVAGPLTSIAIGLIILFMLLSVISLADLLKILSSQEALNQPSALNFFVLGMYINLVLGAFNLFLPIFPMDGGRVLRSMINMMTDRLTATKLAVGIGQGFLAIFFLFAILSGSLWLIAISIFLFIAGLGELKMTELSDALSRVKIKNIVRDDAITLSANTSIVEFQREYEVPWQNIYPVIDHLGKVVGLLRTKNIDYEKGADATVLDNAEKDFPKLAISDKKEDIVAMTYTDGYGIMTDKDGRYVGILLKGDLDDAIRSARTKKKGAYQTGGEI